MSPKTNFTLCMIFLGVIINNDKCFVTLTPENILTITKLVFVILAPENILRIKRQLSYLSCIFRCQSHQNVIVMKIFLYLSFYQPNLRNGEEKNETCKKKKVEGMAIHERCIRWWFHSDQIQRHTYTSIYIEPSLWGYLSCLQHTTRQKGNLQNMGVLTTFIVFLDSSALFSNR